MADSNITKQALAVALRELMQEIPFDKIQVAHICARYNMNRKSFYYHFKDKYDLLNWIFDVEIISFAQKIAETQPFEQRVNAIWELCDYFYENRQFYRMALKIKGQNSLSEHLREYLIPILKLRFAYLIEEDVDDFELSFFADVIACSIEHWLLDKNCMPPKEFIAKLLHIFQRGAETLRKEFDQEE